MDQKESRRPPEYILEVFTDPTCIKEVVRSVLHTIFFHRYFPCHRPGALDVLDLTLPVVMNPELETLIDTRVGQLARQLSSDTSSQGHIRGQLAVHFYEKRRKKGGGLGWFGGSRAEEEVCWEIWRLEISLAMPKTETERTKALRAVASTLRKTALKIIHIANRDKEHIPPITTNDTNPFPYQITLNPKLEGWGKGMGIF